MTRHPLVSVSNGAVVLSDRENQYREWKKRVDGIIANRLGGLTGDDLPDQPYWRWFDEKVTPAKAAGRAIKSAKADFG